MSSIDPLTSVPGLVGVRRPNVDRNVVAAGVFHAAQHEHLGPARRHLEHLLEADGVQVPCVRHDARVGGEDAVHVGVDLAHVGVQRGGQGDGGGVRSTTTQRGDVLAVLADALEAGDQHDQTFVERVAQPAGGDVDDLGVAVRAGGDHAGLRAGEGPRLGAERVDGHGDQGVGDALARGQQHVHFARRRCRADLAGEVQQVVGGVTHRGDDHDDVVACLLGLDDALGDAADPVGVGHRRSTVLLYDERHCLPSVLRVPTKDNASAHPVYSAGSVRMWSRNPPTSACARSRRPPTSAAQEQATTRRAETRCRFTPTSPRAGALAPSTRTRS